MQDFMFVVAGQINCMDAVRRQLDYTSPEGKRYALGERLATLVVRPRGWHLDEKHVLVDGRPAPAALCDFGFYFYHNARELLARGSGPYFYLPKLEHYLEARLWNEVFEASQRSLALPQGTVRATVLVETVLAAFQMDEILHELREHAAGLNAGRWDYLFSIIKNFRHRPEFVLPDRAQLTMTVPFMRAYTELLVKTCHRRGAHALGGMAAFIPNRRDPHVTEVALARVREDKIRVVPLGAEHILAAPCDGGVIAKHQLGDKPFVLAVSSQSPHKNLRALGQAAQLLGAHLRIVLPAHQAQAFAQHLRHFLGRVDLDAVLELGEGKVSHQETKQDNRRAHGRFDSGRGGEL